MCPFLRRMALALAACVMMAAGGHAAEPRAVSTSPKLVGAFVKWGSVGRERTLQEWEKWLGQPTSSVLGVDFYGDVAWEDFHKLEWVPAVWNKLNPARNVIWSVPLTAKGTPLSSVADGGHDAEFEAAARAIAASQPRAVIRLGWEMNVSSMPWFAGGQEADYIAAFRRVVGIFRRYSDGFRYDWCPGWGPQDLAADRAYPGDDVVDYIGLDVYDVGYEGPPEERWNVHHLKNAFGLEWHREFASEHGKLMSYPEWGVGPSGDNPYFVRKMRDWFAENEGRIAYAAYFDVNGMWPTQINNDQFPKSQELFRALFGGR
jgi:hypothetical protein